jgi:hypothetical protein
VDRLGGYNKSKQVFCLATQLHSSFIIGFRVRGGLVIWHNSSFVTNLKRKSVENCKWATGEQCFFLPPNMWGKWVGNHLQEDLAKLVYMLKRTIEKLRNHAIVWWHITTYCLIMAISENPNNVVTNCNFSPQKKKKKKKNHYSLFFWVSRLWNFTQKKRKK